MCDISFFIDNNNNNNYYQCVKLTYSLTGPAGLVKYLNTRPAVLTLDRVSAKLTYFRPP